MGCVQSQAFCTKPPKSTNPSSDAGSLRAQSLDELSSIGVPEIPSRLHNLCHSRDYQCAWKPEMGPMKAWMDISIDDELQPRIVIDLVPELSPQACENFRVLCRAKVGHGYKKTFFHDIEQDMNASGGRFGGVSIFGERFKDEICREQPKYERYNVFMANEGPNTNNTEFFFALGENEFLDGQYVALGNVSAGFDAIDNIEKAGSSLYEDHVICIEDCGGTTLPTDTAEEIWSDQTDRFNC